MTPRYVVKTEGKEFIIFNTRTETIEIICEDELDARESCELANVIVEDQGGEDVPHSIWADLVNWE